MEPWSPVGHKHKRAGERASVERLQAHIVEGVPSGQRPSAHERWRCVPCSAEARLRAPPRGP